MLGSVLRTNLQILAPVNALNTVNQNSSGGGIVEPIPTSPPPIQPPIVPPTLPPTLKRRCYRRYCKKYRGTPRYYCCNGANCPNVPAPGTDSYRGSNPNLVPNLYPTSGSDPNNSIYVISNQGAVAYARPYANSNVDPQVPVSY